MFEFERKYDTNNLFDSIFFELLERSQQSVDCDEFSYEYSPKNVFEMLVEERNLPIQVFDYVADILKKLPDVKLISFLDFCSSSQKIIPNDYIRKMHLSEKEVRECYVDTLLNSLNLGYHSEYYIPEGHVRFDYYIPALNVIVETKRRGTGLRTKRCLNQMESYMTASGADVYILTDGLVYDVYVNKGASNEWVLRFNMDLLHLFDSESYWLCIESISGLYFLWNLSQEYNPYISTENIQRAYDNISDLSVEYEYKLMDCDGKITRIEGRKKCYSSGDMFSTANRLLLEYANIEPENKIYGDIDIELLLSSMTEMEELCETYSKLTDFGVPKEKDLIEQADSNILLEMLLERYSKRIEALEETLLSLANRVGVKIDIESKDNRLDVSAL